MRIIYNGGYVATLAVQENPKESFYGWLFFKHPDGQWASLADLKKLKFTAPMQECIDKADIFFDDVMPQIGTICLQDYENMNELGILLAKLRSK